MKRLVAFQEAIAFGLAYAAALVLFLFVAGSDIVFETRWPFYDDFDEPPIVWIVPTLGLVAGLLAWFAAIRRSDLSGWIATLRTGVLAGAVSTGLALALLTIGIGVYVIAVGVLKQGFNPVLFGAVLGGLGLATLLGMQYVLVPVLPFIVAGGIVGTLAVRALRSRTAPLKTGHDA